MGSRLPLQLLNSTRYEEKRYKRGHSPGGSARRSAACRREICVGERAPVAVFVLRLALILSITKLMILPSAASRVNCLASLPKQASAFFG